MMNIAHWAHHFMKNGIPLFRTKYYLLLNGGWKWLERATGNFKLDVKRITPHPLAANDDICAVGVTFAPVI